MIDIKIGQMTEESWPEVARIYEAGITTRNATFQTPAGVVPIVIMDT